MVRGNIQEDIVVHTGGPLLESAGRGGREGWGSGDGSETGLVKKKKGNKTSTTGIGASLTPDFRDKEEATTTMPLN